MSLIVLLKELDDLLDKLTEEIPPIERKLCANRAKEILSELFPG